MRNPFRYFNSSPEVIRLTVMMYIRYPLSLRLSLPFIPSCLPTAVRLSGTDIILSQRILKLTTGAVITMLIPPDRASKPMQGHADAGSVHGGTEKN